MVHIYKTKFPSEMTDAQRNFVIEMLKGMIPSKRPVDVTEEIENAIIVPARQALPVG